MPSSHAKPCSMSGRLAPPDVDQFLSASRSSGAEPGRCALWWTAVPALPGERLGCIGQYHAADGPAASDLLSQACAVLAGHGVTLAIGPLDGNTWRPHRFVTGGSDRAPFPMEPHNPPSWPQHFLDNGFQVISHYSSSVLDLHRENTHQSFAAREHERRLIQGGISFRALDPDRLEEELRDIYRLSLVSFAKNFLFTPVSEAAFVASYRGAARGMDPALVRIAEADGKLSGFVFAYPDTRCGGAAAIVKTLAVRPDYRLAGLGTVLVQQVHDKARRLGYREVIHALQHENNPSLRINRRMGAKVFRTYALYAKRISP